MNEDWTKDIQRLMADRQVKAPDGLLEEVKKRLASTTPVAPSKQVQPARTVTMWRYRWLTAAAVAAAIAVPVTWRMLKVDESPRVVAVSRAIHQSANRAEASSVPGTQANETRSAIDADATSALGVSAVGHEVAMLSERDETPANRQVTDGKQGDINANTQTVGETNEATLGQTAPMTSSEGKQLPKAELRETKPESRETKPERRETKAEPRETKPGRRFGRNDYQYQAEADYTYHRSASISSPLSLTAYYGGAINGNGLAADRGVTLADAYHSDEMPFGAFPMELGKANLLMFRQPERKAHHAQPIKVGASVGYRLSSRWAVNTGVTYSYLSSNFTEDGRVVERQKLHYVGVPLTASYSFVRTKHAEVYLTAGGEVEMLVKGSKGIDNSERDNLTEKRPQWSLKAAVGGAYHFTQSLSLYAEPGMTHYFDNHSSIVNVYKDKPTSFSLNVGLRFDVK